MSKDSYLAFAHQLADRAGQTILPYFRRDIPVENKSTPQDYDPVTEADREAERVIRQLIGQHHPSHGIVGEEFGLKNPDGALRWIIDPIDGTRAFISGLPLWGILIGLYQNERPLLGIMDQPFTGERFVGADGRAELIHGQDVRPLSVRPCERLADALLFSTDPGMFQLPGELEAFQRVGAATRLTRFGGDCYAYCMLAMGQIDLVIEADLEVYDIAALVPIIEFAGGVVSRWDGADAIGAGRIVAAGDRRVHQQALELLNR